MGRRVKHWESRLTEFVESCANRPFKWGEHDCATFAMKAIEVITGEYPIEETWASARKARRLIEERSLIDRANDIWPQVDVNLCQRGDLVATMTPDGVALGIFVSPMAAFSSKHGLALLRREDLIMAWSI